MSNDLEQFYEIFFEESSELLADMEACLLRLDVNSPDLEDLNAIFRAAHSIKGGAGTFGFTDMTETTHMLETLLDKLRKGELEVRSEMVDAFLKAGDVIKHQLAGHRGEGEADPAEAAAVLKELKRLSDDTQTSAKKEESEVETKVDVPEEKTTVNTSSTPVSETQAKHNYCIKFSKFGLNEAALENLFSNLKLLGNLQDKTTSGDHDLCKLFLATDKSEEDVWEALAFIVDPEKLEIESIESNSVDDKISQVPPTNNAEITYHQDEEMSLDKMPPAPGYGFFPDAPAAPREDGSSDLAAKSSNQNADQRQAAKSSAKAAPAAASSEASSIRVSIEKVD